MCKHLVSICRHLVSMWGCLVSLVTIYGHEVFIYFLDTCTAGEIYLGSPADFVHLPTDKEMI